MWLPFWISNQNDFSYFSLQFIPIFPTKFWVNWPFCSGDFQNRFSRWLPWWPSWILGWTYFSYFLSTSCPTLPTKFKVNWPIHSWGEVQNRFSRWYLGVQIGTILASFDLQVIPILPTNIRVNWHLGFPIGKILTLVDLQVTLILHTKFWGFFFFFIQEMKFKITF